jgi:hypothetical protein
MLSRQLSTQPLPSYANVDRLLRTEPQVQLTNPPVLNNHSNDFKSHRVLTFIKIQPLSWSYTFPWLVWVHQMQGDESEAISKNTL